MIYVLLLFVGILAGIRLPVLAVQPGGAFNQHEKLVTNWFIFFVLLSLIVGLRYEVGTDFRSYVEYFERFQSGRNIPNVEWGFAALNRLAVSVGLGYWFVFLSCAVLTNYFVLKYLSDYTPYLWLAVIILFGIGFFFRQTNQIRQMVALAFTLYSTRYIVERRPVEFFLTCLIATGFHLTALIMVPMYWLSRVSWHKNSLAILVLISFGAFVTPIGSWLMEAILPRLAPPAYSHYVDRVLGRPGFTATGLRVGAESVAASAIIFFLPQRVDRIPEFRIYRNLFAFAFIAQGLLAPYWAVHRIPVYLLVYQAVFLPCLLRELNLPKRDKIPVVGMVALYYLFFAFLAVFRNSHDILPYSSILFA